MSSNTPNGAPYPDNDDLVEDLPAAIQALAGWVNPRGFLAGKTLLAGTALSSIKTSGMYVEPGGSPDRPAAASAVYGLVLVFANGDTGNSESYLQVFMNRDATNLFIRAFLGSSGWTAWKRIALT